MGNFPQKQGGSRGTARPPGKGRTKNGSKSGPITISQAAEGFIRTGILGFMGGSAESRARRSQKRPNNPNACFRKTKIRQPQQACQILSNKFLVTSHKFQVNLSLGGRFQEGGGAILALEVSSLDTCRRQGGKSQGPRSRPEGPKTPQDASKTPQDGPRRP